MLIGGGLLIDRFGARKVAVLALGFIVLGVTLFAVSPSFYGKLVGRLIFGVGLEPMEVCQDALLVRWFAGVSETSEDDESGCECQKLPSNSLSKYPSFSFALSVTFSVNMLGQLIGLVVLPLVAKMSGQLSVAFQVVTLACFVSLLITGVIFVVDQVRHLPCLHPGSC